MKTSESYIVNDAFEVGTALMHYIRCTAPAYGSFIARPLPPYDVETERAFRRWHLAIHADLRAGHDEHGELAVAREHERKLRAAGLDDFDVQAVFFDTWGGFIYASHHGGEFPVYAGAFIAACFTRGFSAAIHEDFSYGRVQHANTGQDRKISSQKLGAGAIRGGAPRRIPGSKGKVHTDDWAL